MNDPYAPPSGSATPSEDSGDLLPASLRLRGHSAVAGPWTVVRNVAWVGFVAGATVAARFQQARTDAPAELRPYVFGTDIVVRLRLPDAAAARRAFEAREREMLEHPQTDEAGLRRVDQMRAILTACIPQAEAPRKASVSIQQASN